jgi:hypothetical protein
MEGVEIGALAIDNRYCVYVVLGVRGGGGDGEENEKELFSAFCFEAPISTM